MFPYLIIVFTTVFQKLVLKKVTVPKVPSHKACSRTVYNRTQQVQSFIRDVSSPIQEDEEAAVHQLAALLKGKSYAELQDLIKDRGILKIRIPAGEELALKAQMGWSWKVLKGLRRQVQIVI